MSPRTTPNAELVQYQMVLRWMALHSSHWHAPDHVGHVVDAPCDALNHAALLHHAADVPDPLPLLLGTRTPTGKVAQGVEHVQLHSHPLETQPRVAFCEGEALPRREVVDRGVHETRRHEAIARCGHTGTASFMTPAPYVV